MTADQIISIVSTATVAIGTIIIAIATWKYTNYSKKNLEELKKQNEFLKEKETEGYVLKRKKIILDLLEEININKIIIGPLVGSIDNSINKMKEIDKDSIVNLGIKNIQFKKLEDIISSLSKRAYSEFLKRNISFKSNEVNSKLSIYFETLLILPYINLKSFEQYTLSQKIESEELIKKAENIKSSLEEIFKVTEEIYDVVKKDMKIDYRELPEYIPF